MWKEGDVGEEQLLLLGLHEQLRGPHHHQKQDLLLQQLGSQENIYVDHIQQRTLNPALQAGCSGRHSQVCVHAPTNSFSSRFVIVNRSVIGPQKTTLQIFAFQAFGVSIISAIFNIALYIIHAFACDLDRGNSGVKLLLLYLGSCNSFRDKM